MQRPPFPVDLQLAGWALLWADVAAEGAGASAAAPLRAAEAAARAERAGTALTDDPMVAALRRLFRAAGTDPTRYRPSSEALLRRVLKGEEVPLIHPLVDLNNALSLRLAAPCCVMAAGAVQPPFALRAGRAGEEYLSLRGPFALDGRPLLVDASGPCDTPITGNERVKVDDTTVRAWLVAYLPAAELPAARAAAALASVLGEAAGLTTSLVAASVPP